MGAGDAQAGDQVGVRRVGEPDDVDPMAGRGEGHPGVVQGGTAAEGEEAAVGVGDRQLPRAVGVQVQHAGTYRQRHGCELNADAPAARAARPRPAAR